MRRFSLLAMALCTSFIGCKPPAETVPKVTNSVPSSGTTADPAAEESASKTAPAAGDSGEAKPAAGAADPAPPADTPASSDPAKSDSSSTGNAAAVRFVADKKLEIPGMMCPYGCFPSVQKTLASVPGVKGVQLAEQPAGTKEGEIALKVVELKLGEGFDLAAAIAALKQADFEASEMN